MFLGEMRQRNPEFAAILPLEDVARAIGIDAREIAPNGRLQGLDLGEIDSRDFPFRLWKSLK